MSYRAWFCESCERPNRREWDIWECPGCKKETCEHCFDRYAHCKKCAAGMSHEEMRLAANAAGWDFEPNLAAVAHE